MARVHRNNECMWRCRACGDIPELFSVSENLPTDSRDNPRNYPRSREPRPFLDAASFATHYAPPVLFAAGTEVSDRNRTPNTAENNKHLLLRWVAERSRRRAGRPARRLLRRRGQLRPPIIHQDEARYEGPQVLSPEWLSLRRRKER